MSVFLERFVLPILAAVVMGVIMLNPLKFDWHQRISLLIAVVAFAYFVGRTIHVGHATHQQPPSVAVPAGPSHTSGSATTTGNNSPANTGDGNTITIDTPTPSPKAK